MCDPEQINDSKNIGIAKALSILGKIGQEKLSLQSISRLLAVNDLELDLLKRLSFSRYISVYS